jgi:phage tail tape-measure protein
MSEKVYVHCPACGKGFVHMKENSVKVVTVKTAGGAGGFAAGATIGAKLGAFLGPIGMAAGGLIGGVAGGLAGKSVGDDLARPRCPECGVKFVLPSNM